MKLTKEQFQQAYLDSEGAGPFFTSDLHFYHKRIVEYSGRPWTTDAQTQTIIDRWNERVGWDDDIYHLGDFAFIWPKKMGQLFEILGELHGKMHFIRGNHCDPKVWQLVEQQNLPFIEWIKDYHEMSVQGQRIVLCHYPMEVWNGSHHGSWMLHGHCHGSLPPRGKRLDVGLDSHPDFRVFSYAEVAAHMAKQKIAIMDHHNGMRD